MTHPTWGDKPPRVAGSLPPMRPDQELQVALTRAGSGPAPQSPVVVARLVLVGGGTVSGVFVYDPTIGFGNLVGWMTDSALDPFGNVDHPVVGAGNPATTAAGFLTKNANLHFTTARMTFDSVLGAQDQGAGSTPYPAPNSTWVSPAQAGSTAQMQWTLLGGDKTPASKGPWSLLGPVTIGGIAGQYYANQHCWYAPGTGVDDGAAINAIFALGVQTITTLPGTASLRSVAIALDTDQTLQGYGGMCKLSPTAAFTDTYLIKLKTPATTRRVTIRDLYLDINYQLNASSGTIGGINLDNTGWVGSQGDQNPNHLVQHCQVVRASGDGYHLDNVMRELRMENCIAQTGLGFGFFLGDGGGTGKGITDSHFTDCTAGNNALNGWEILGSNNMFVNCKGYGSGNNQQSGVFASTTYNWHLNNTGTHCNFNLFTGCHSQQAGLHNWFLDGCADTALTGCDADSAGAGAAVPTGYGVLISAAVRCSVNGVVGSNNSPAPHNQVFGIAIQGVCTDTWITANPVAGTSGTFTNLSGSAYYLIDGPTITDLTHLNNFRFGAPVFFEASPVTLVTGATLTIGPSAGTYAVTSVAPVTGILLTAWVRGGGALINIVNTGANTIAFPAGANLGLAFTLAAAGAAGNTQQLVWDTNNAVWYPI